MHCCVSKFIRLPLIISVPHHLSCHVSQCIAVVSEFIRQRQVSRRATR
jgi:hypothetical protein